MKKLNHYLKKKKNHISRKWGGGGITDLDSGKVKSHRELVPKYYCRKSKEEDQLICGHFDIRGGENLSLLSIVIQSCRYSPVVTSVPSYDHVSGKCTH